MLMNWIIFGLLCLASSLGGIGVRAYDHEISEQRDHKVLLSCPIDFKACGELHSVKWFKGNTRIAVVSGDGEVATVKDEYMSRMSIDHSPKGPVTSLSIKSLQIADEDVYTCESTFLEPRESCDTSGVYRIDLKVEVPPSAVHILDENGKFVKNGTKYGPLREGHKLKSICEVKATRPVPTVAWYRGGKRLTDSLHVDEQNGLFYVKSELLLIVSRLELGNNIECRVESPSLDDEIITNYLALDLEVPPTSINLTGVEHHTVQGTNVLLECKVHGARPAVTMAWFNASHEIDIRHSDAVQIETKSIEQRDGTYETISDLKFVATRYEDGLKFRCEAQNVVMRDNKDKPLHESLVLEVLYPPVVSVKPENLTVQEGREVLLFCDYEANPATLQSVKWFQNGKLLNLGESNRYEGGNPEHTALLIKESTRYDDGVYTCELANNIGAETSDNEIYLEVQFPPVVNLTMDPDSPMIENDEGNVTLYCNVLEGNPPTLSKVRWFLGGELLKELPECNGDGSDELCNIDPSRLLLQNIGRQFLGNYSCEGLNSAGWGARSKENELIVYYEPGNATIRHNPQIAVKRKSVSFTCSVDDPGFPAATTYHWLRGGRVVHEVTSNLYTVDPVGLDSRTNFTCYAFNAGGSGNSATVLLDVHAAPAFINPLMPYSGVLYSTGNASLTCRVECVPECSISWFKDGVGIDESSDKYYITEKYLEADPATGDFESVLSVLNFNMTAWPQGKFDIYADNANYSCVSTNNSAGPGVRSATYFGIEYPPENTTVSKDIVTVEEDNIPERILCSAKGNPEPLYEWQFNGSVITRGSALIINHKMAKSDAGAYECFAYNKHGRHSAVTNITVTYKPTCEIVRKEIEDEDTLICTAIGNPKEADFHWSIKSENDSIDLGSGETVGESNYLVLEDEFSVTRVYRCVANNSVGAGPYCQIEVAGHLSWWQRWDKITLIILVASVLGVLLALIVLCCVIVCICRRRRRRDKSSMQKPILLNNKSSALGDPLTEPGEYENLPFHGLQTAPNKFATPPSINFNNSNVVRVAPRPKQVTNNNTNNTTSYAHHQQSHYPLTQSTLLKQSYPLSTSQTLLLSSSSANNGHGGVNSSSAGNMTNCSSSNTVGGGGHSRQYSLSNCFPTSYTAYYQQQQQHKGSSSKNSAVDNSFANSCPYTVQSQNSSTNSHNPFVVQNLRKFNTNSGCRQSGAHRKKTPDPEKKFYSLKSLGNRKGGGLHFCSIKPSLSSSKCKRHHSFAGGSVGDIVTSGNCIGPTQHTLPFMGQQQLHQQNDSKMKFYEPPLYENLTDSIQIHESSMVSGRPHGKHQQHHQVNDDINNLMEPERLSIYRSDSGISNSSYECATPVPAPRQLLKQKSSSHSSKCQNHSPLYMNLANNASNTCSTERATPPPLLPPPSTSQQQHQSASNSNHPTCLNASSNFNSSNSSSSNGNGSHCNGANKCNQPNNNNSKDTVQSYCQRQQQPHHDLKHHQLPNHQQRQESQHARHGSSNRSRCKKRAQNSASLLSLEHVSNTSNNPFLAAGTSSSSGFNSLNEHGGGASSSSSSSTTTNRCRPKSQQQQILVPKDHSQIMSLNKRSSMSAFNPLSNNHKSRTNSKHVTNSAKNPTASTSYCSSYNSDNNLTDPNHYNDPLQQHSYHKSNGYIIRPMKLPLRKHHSFHFQPSQTVAGSSSQKSGKHSTGSSVCNYRTNYKLNGGPLVFKPLLNENSAFKPITPASSTNCSRVSTVGNPCSDSVKTPRICGTSLKRHMSNVESYDGSRYKKHSLSSPGLSMEDEELSGNEDDDEDDIGIDDEDDDDIDEIIITQEEDPPSSSSNSTIVGKRLVYADLASLNSSLHSSRNLRSISTSISADSHHRDRQAINEFDDLTINSDSEQFRRSARYSRPLPYNGFSQSGSYEQDHASEASILGTPIKRRTQYATMKYNEVNI
ncbi:uncharacterized protein LOC119649806 isoform X3 [Hermetia illucens]|uniref:uncharacterized protein LOC119649806 isoform X3 n=1 Tax=Hermetia illucens TaxID=343691 RepID=UPI0018CC58E8|nr:uncharacterized protein LOC119649806 isoform X3 [Hermetia illucens]